METSPAMHRCTVLVLEFLMCKDLGILVPAIELKTLLAIALALSMLAKQHVKKLPQAGVLPHFSYHTAAI